MNTGIDRALSIKLDPIKVSPIEHEKMMMNITRKNQKLHFPCRVSFALTTVLICFVLTASALAVTLSIIEARKQWESEKGEMRFWSIEDQTQFLHITEEEFNARMAHYKEELSRQFAESRELETEIMKQLEQLRFTKKG